MANTDPHGFCDPTKLDWDQTEECLLTKTWIWSNWLGPLVIGWVLSTLLLGMLLCQTLNYFSTFKFKDRKSVIFTVFFIIIANIVSGSTEWALMYRILVQWEPFGFFDPIKDGWPPSHVVGVWLIPAIIIAVIQSHFARSAYEVSRSRVLLYLIFICIVLGLTGGMGVSGAQIRIDSLSPNLPSAGYVNFQQGMVYLFVSSDLVADLMMTTTFCLSLYRQQSSLLYNTPTRSLITMLIRHSISTCACSTIIALGVLAATVEYDGKAKLQFQTSRIHTTTMAHSCIQIVVPRVYSCTYMFVLNSRPAIRALSRRGTEGELTIGILTVHDDVDPATLTKRSAGNPSTGGVHLASFPPQGISFTRDTFTQDEISGRSINGDDSLKEVKPIIESKEDRVFGEV